MRYESHLLYSAEFRQMAEEFPQFRFWPTLTQPGPNWIGRKGRVQAHLPEAVSTVALATSPGAVNLDLDVYLCGMKAMVDGVRNLLKNMGYDRKQIRSEKYD